MNSHNSHRQEAPPGPPPQEGAQKGKFTTIPAARTHSAKMDSPTRVRVPGGSKEARLEAPAVLGSS